MGNFCSQRGNLFWHWKHFLISWMKSIFWSYRFENNWTKKLSSLLFRVILVRTKIMNKNFSSIFLLLTIIANWVILSKLRRSFRKQNIFLNVQIILSYFFLLSHICLIFKLRWNQWFILPVRNTFKASLLFDRVGLTRVARYDSFSLNGF